MGGVPKQLRRLGEAPWLALETTLVMGSLALGILATVLLAILVHIFLLGDPLWLRKEDGTPGC